jgi:hypothetical protein
MEVLEETLCVNRLNPKSKLFYDRRSGSQSVLLSGHNLGNATNLYFSSTEFIFRHLRFLTMRWVCTLQLLLGLASEVFLGTESRGTPDHILLYQFWDFDNLEGEDPNLFPPGTGWLNYIPRHWVQTKCYHSPSLYSHVTDRKRTLRKTVLLLFSPAAGTLPNSYRGTHTERLRDDIFKHVLFCSK